jgi:hypothetical protein
MKFQIVLAAIFTFVAVSTKKGNWGQTNQRQNVDIHNNACSEGNALAINCAGYGNANAAVFSNAANYNCVSQRQ